MQALADRFTYVPLIGLWVMLVWGVWELAGAWRLGRLASAATVAALAVCAVLTVHQEFYWKDTESFYKRMIDVAPDNFWAHNNLGTLYIKENRFNEALPHFMAAVEEKPNFPQAHNNLGTLFRMQKRYDEAILQYRTAIRLRPEFLYYFNLAKALAEDANVRHDTGEFAEAVETSQQALKLNPSDYRTECNLAFALSGLGKRDEAAKHYRAALGINPNLTEAQQALSALEGNR
jgi:tetratricopeptide (TPR) repeat protein